MEITEIKYFIEAAMLAAGRPLSIDQLRGLFDDDSAPDKAEIREALASLETEYAPRGIAIGEVASGYRMQVRPSMCERLGRLWEERPPRYSRALFETLALIAYRQPMTRGEIEEIRGVTVSTNIIRTLQEREWVRVVGHRDVPGRPAMFGTTREFLDYFGLKKLDDLPPLADLSDWESLRVQLNLPAVSEEDERGESADIMPLPLAARLLDSDADLDAGDGETDDSDAEVDGEAPDQQAAPSDDTDTDASDAVLDADGDLDDPADSDEDVDRDTGNTAVRNG